MHSHRPIIIYFSIDCCHRSGIYCYIHDALCPACYVRLSSCVSVRYFPIPNVNLKNIYRDNGCGAPNRRISLYSLFGHPLSKVASHSYPGVKLDSKLSWAKHITEITSKSAKVLGMVKLNLGPCKPAVKDTAYNMLVRPKLHLFGTHIGEVGA